MSTGVLFCVCVFFVNETNWAKHKHNTLANYENANVREQRLFSVARVSFTVNLQIESTIDYECQQSFQLVQLPKF